LVEMNETFQADNAWLLAIVTTIMPQVGRIPMNAMGGKAPDVWDPEGYCHSHGYKVGHNSQTCMNTV
jgi:hypothetical protein